MPFFLIIGSIWLVIYLNKKTHFLARLFFNKNKQDILHRFYTANFNYYTLLDEAEQKNFLLRVTSFLETNQLKINPQISNTNHKVELLVSAAYAQITFGYEDYEITSFTKIIVDPDTFYSKLANHQVKGLTVGTGYIFYSWADFLKGYELKNDNVNLALHELAHALYIDRFRDTENPEWQLWETRAAGVLELEKSNTTTVFFRAYGKTNLYEFWAATVECFFENPINLKKQYENLYNSTAGLLKQDMAERLLLKEKASTIN